MFTLALAAALCSHAPQPEPKADGKLAFEMWNPQANGGQGAWGAAIQGVKAGERVEVRVAEYTGTRTDLFALGDALLQPVIPGEGSLRCAGDDALVINCVQAFVEGAQGGAPMPDLADTTAALYTFVARTCP